MTVDDVIELLESHADPRGIAAWERLGIPGRSVGLGLTAIKRLAKQVPRDHALAHALWESDLYDAKLLSAQIGQPELATIEEAEAAVDGARANWILSHAWCSGWLARTSFAADLVDRWYQSEDPLRRRCAYLLLAQISKQRTRVDAWYLSFLDRIEKEIHQEENFVRDAMNVALLYVGQRSAPCWRRALEVARNIGPVEVDYGENSCRAVDVVKHLSSPRIKAAFDA